jgi:catechol 2,3-dioxygenase-like lactoylglutathione lyase family enzyme
VINGAHAIIYSKDADADRAFLRDVLGFGHVDAGHGWLIFALPPAEVAVHPTDGEPRHELYLMCDDIERTLTGLREQGVPVSDVTEERWGMRAAITLPSGTGLGVYQPRHPVAHNG